MSDELEPAPTPVPAGKWQAISTISAKNPIMGVAALFFVGGGGGVLGSVYVAPVVDDALEQHEDDPRAHAELVSRLERLEGKVADMDEDLERGTDTINDMAKGFAVLRARLEDR
jgi:hypothetical protein